MQMTIKQKSIYLFLAIFSTTLLLSSNTFAATPESDGKKGAEKTPQVSRKKTCEKYKDSQKDKCEEAWNESAGRILGRKFAQEAIDANSSSSTYRDKCNRPSKADKPSRSYYCRLAFDNKLKSEAKKKGEELGKSNASNPDKNAADVCRAEVKYGGSKVQTACKAGYKKGETGGRNNCGDVNTYFDYGDICDGNTKEGGNDNPIFGILLSIMNILAGLVSLAVVGGILYGAFLYASARDNSQQTQKGIQVITDAVIALILYFALYAIINFIVPGGLFT